VPILLISLFVLTVQNREEAHSNNAQQNEGRTKSSGLNLWTSADAPLSPGALAGRCYNLQQQ